MPHNVRTLVRTPQVYKSKNELLTRVCDYFAYCDENKKPYTISGLELYLGIYGSTIKRYIKKYKQFKPILGAALKLCEVWMEESLYTGGNNQMGLIFGLKNRWKWQDRHDITSDNKALDHRTIMGTIIAGVDVTQIHKLSQEELVKLSSKQLDQVKSEKLDEK